VTTFLLALLAAPYLGSFTLQPRPALQMRRSSRLAGAVSCAAPTPGAPKQRALASKPAAAKRSAPASRSKAESTPAAKAAAKRPKTSTAAANEAEGGATTKREAAAWARGVELCVGCDEAGRGPLAGPVVAAACALPASAPRILGVSDSKTIVDEAAREALYEQIVSTPGVAWSARVVSAARIDEVNILMASLEAMRLSIVDVLEQQAPKTALALVDGPFSPWKEGDKYVDFQTPAPPAAVALEVEPVKKGDASVYCIAAASILAKVTRDRLMHRYDALWPAYGLSQHKGYPTGQHVAAISKHGPCAVHRRTFAPLKSAALPPPTKAELAQAEAVVREYEAARGGKGEGKKK
jgi:ribonuclease HII